MKTEMDNSMYSNFRLYNDSILEYPEDWPADFPYTDYVRQEGMAMKTPGDALATMFGRVRGSEINMPEILTGKQFCTMVYLVELAHNIPEGLLLNIPERVRDKQEYSCSITAMEIVCLVRFLCVPSLPCEPSIPDNNNSVSYERYQEFLETGKEDREIKSTQNQNNIGLNGNNKNLFKWTKFDKTDKCVTWHDIKDTKILSNEAETMTMVSSNSVGTIVLALFSHMGYSIVQDVNYNWVCVPKFWASLRVNHRALSNTDRIATVDDKGHPVDGIMATFNGQLQKPYHNEAMFIFPYALGIPSEDQVSKSGLVLSTDVGESDQSNRVARPKFASLNTHKLMDLYEEILDVKWGSKYKFEGLFGESDDLLSQVALDKQAVQDGFRGCFVYATLLHDFNDRVSGFSDPTVLWWFHAQLERKFRSMFGGSFVIAYPRDTSQAFLQCRLMLRALCRIVGAGISDAKMDGNHRVASMVYAVMRLRPEKKSENMLNPQCIRGPDLQWMKMATALQVTYVVPVKLDMSILQETLKQVSSDVQKEKSEAVGRSVGDFVLDFLLRLQKEDSQMFRAYDYKLPENIISDGKRSINSTGIERKEKQVEMFAKRFDDLLGILKADDLKMMEGEMKSLYDANIEEAQKKKTRFLTKFATYSYTKPRSNPLFTMLLMYLGQYLIYDDVAGNSASKKNGRLAWFDSFQRLVESNGKSIHHCILADEVHDEVHDDAADEATKKDTDDADGKSMKVPLSGDHFIVSRWFPRGSHANGYTPMMLCRECRGVRKWMDGFYVLCSQAR
jgi:hypothetical protein